MLENEVEQPSSARRVPVSARALPRSELAAWPTDQAALGSVPEESWLFSTAKSEGLLQCLIMTAKKERIDTKQGGNQDTIMRHWNRKIWKKQNRKWWTFSWHLHAPPLKSSQEQWPLWLAVASIDPLCTHFNVAWSCQERTKERDRAIAWLNWGVLNEIDFQRSHRSFKDNSNQLSPQQQHEHWSRDKTYRCADGSWVWEEWGEGAGRRNSTGGEGALGVGCLWQVKERQNTNQMQHCLKKTRQKWKKLFLMDPESLRLKQDVNIAEAESHPVLEHVGCKHSAGCLIWRKKAETTRKKHKANTFGIVQFSPQLKWGLLLARLAGILNTTYVPWIIWNLDFCCRSAWDVTRSRDLNERTCSRVEWRNPIADGKQGDWSSLSEWSGSSTTPRKRAKSQLPSQDKSQKRKWTARSSNEKRPQANSQSFR